MAVIMAVTLGSGWALLPSLGSRQAVMEGKRGKRGGKKGGKGEGKGGGRKGKRGKRLFVTSKMALRYSLAVLSSGSRQQAAEWVPDPAHFFKEPPCGVVCKMRVRVGNRR